MDELDSYILYSTHLSVKKQWHLGRPNHNWIYVKTVYSDISK